MMEPWLRLPASRFSGSLPRILLGAAAFGCLIGCGPESAVRDRRQDSLTSGVLRIAAEPDVFATVRATAEAFMKSYPEATIAVTARESREAMADVFANRADLAVIGREIEPIERQAATEAALEMEAYRWAREGVAVIAHPSNPVNQVSYDDLREILSGEITSWADLGGPDRRLVPVVQDPEKGLAQYVARQVAEREAVSTAAVLAMDDAAVVREVRNRPDALGFVAQPALGPGIKLLAVSRAKGMPYVELDAETVYHRDYPLTRSFNLVTRVPGVRLGHGFITFATSEPGQRLVRDDHRVPATVPVRFNRRLPTASSH
jgi:phosphate transport system substrate-binding protein